MLDSFLIAFREALQCSVLAALVIHYPRVRDNRNYRNSLIAGLFVALSAGFSAGYIPYAGAHLWTNESWTFWRYISESVIFYLSVLFLLVRPSPPAFMASAGLFLLGLFLFVFEARSVGFLVQDIGAMNGKTLSVLALGTAGIITGSMPIVFFKSFIRKISFDKIFTFPSLLMVLGSLQFGFGGVGELEKENILIPLQRGFINFLGEAVKSMQSALLIQGHPFISITFSGLANFLSGDRTAMTLTLLFIMAPPLLILSRIFSRPDPVVSSLQAGAQRRYQIAFFRKELIYQSTPVLIAFVILVVLLHAVNISLNPLYEPVPVPIRESGNEAVLKMPLSDRSGDFSDKKLRKFVYYYGNKQIVFIAILKPDGSVGVALDECEICRPADWNTDAKGYAQRGEHLVCKYCMTPITTSTLNNPGGCNPIPLPFRMEDNTIVITQNDLITTFKKVQESEKKGTHL